MACLNAYHILLVNDDKNTPIKINTVFFLKRLKLKHTMFASTNKHVNL